ncbi:MAG: Eco57I restriction-modification methylase domain-containing protein, partial [Terriglobales bacterium]
MNAADPVQALHDRCAIYTAAETATKLLDLIGWTVDADLTSARLLEPCVGEGAILTEAVRRLCAVAVRRWPLRKDILAGRIAAFELHPATADKARQAVLLVLREFGLASPAARQLAAAWVKTADFLLQPVEPATHVVANPPYVRWAKVPPSLAVTYRKEMRPTATRGDLSVAFLDRMLDWATDGGRVVAIVSDRWMFAQYGDPFLRDTARRRWSLRIIEERPRSPFERSVGAYSSIVSFEKIEAGNDAPALSFVSRGARHSEHANLVSRHGTLEDAGADVRVGPA